MTEQPEVQFEKLYGGRPTHLVTSPGRVNLIGEHTDYNLLPVLPMAIGAGIRMWVRANSTGIVRAHNIDNSFPPVEFPCSASIEPNERGHWANYVKAAVNQMWPAFVEKLGKPAGFDAVIESTLPPAAGLSSSSALVVGSYVALAAVNGVRFDPMYEAEMMRQAERYVGTAGGGMDQSIIVLGQKNHALLIEFDPLRTRSVPVAPGAVYFAVNSLKRAPKAGSVRFEYNRRSFECQAGMLIMQKWVQEEGADFGLPDGLRKGAENWQSLRDAWQDLKKYVFPVPGACVASLGTEVWSLERLLDRLGKAGSDLLATKMMPDPADDAWKSFAGFPLHARVQHVFSETDRVWECVEAMETGNLAKVAALIGESHTSCRDLYHISTPALEQLVNDARQCGAMAARITGAGFGGSIVVMVADEAAAFFPEKLWERFYADRIRRGELPATTMAEAIIRCEAEDGAHSNELNAASAGSVN